VITQIKGIVTTVVYDAIVSFIILKVIDMTLGLRVSEDIERDGIDLNLHGEVVQ
jgi:ammonium transporter, Amt family